MNTPRMVINISKIAYTRALFLFPQLMYKHDQTSDQSPSREMKTCNIQANLVFVQSCVRSKTLMKYTKNWSSFTFGFLLAVLHIISLIFFKYKLEKYISSKLNPILNNLLFIDQLASNDIICRSVECSGSGSVLSFQR